MQKKNKKVLTSEPATLLDSLESKKERKKKGRWNKVFFFFFIIVLHGKSKRDENDLSSDEDY